MMQQQQYAASITDPNMPVQFAATIDAVLAAYERDPENEAAQADLIRTVERAVDLAKEMREFTNNCQREGLALPDSFAAWHIALSKLTTQQVVNALNHIFDKNQERLRRMQENGMPDRGPAFAPEAAAHIDLDQLRQSLRMTGDLNFEQNTYYAAQEEQQRAEKEAEYERQQREAERRRAFEESAYQSRTTSTKDWLGTLLLCIFTGAVGGHCFYTGRIGKGILYLFTGGLWGLGVLYDLIKLGTGTFQDGEGRYVRNK